jgi:hypothetical protein
LTRQLFIYWRVEPAALPAALMAVHAAQAGLRAEWTGLLAQVYQRCDLAPQATVMETYSAPGGIDAAGEQRIELALAGIAPGTRHVEAFSPA